MKTTIIERIEAKIDKSGQCWVWTGGLNSNGYGTLSINGKPTGVHRAYYELVVGLVPKGLELDHLCENKACVLPSHLEPVTHRENTARYYRNRYSFVCKNGHPRSRTKLYWHSINKRYAKFCLDCHLEMYYKRRVLQPKKEFKYASAGLIPKNNKTHCIHGHTLVGDNIKWRKDGTRDCRTCANLCLKRLKLRRKQSKKEVNS